MKVAIIRRKFRFGGGGEKAAENYLKRYVKGNSSVSLLTQDWSGSLPQDVQLKKIAVSGNRVRSLFEFTQRVTRFLADSDFDLVQSHEWIPKGVDILRLGDGLHSVWFECLSNFRGGCRRLLLYISPFHRLKMYYEKKSIMSADLKQILVNSTLVKDQLISRYPDLKTPIIVQRNPVSDEFFLSSSRRINSSRTSNKLRMLFVGSGWERKRLDICLQALDACEFTTLDIFGHDKLEKRIRSWVAKQHFSNRVAFHGTKPLSIDDYWDYDLLLALSLYDPFPNAVSEALVSNLKVITSENCGAVDFVDGKTVFVAKNLEEIVGYIIDIHAKQPASTRLTINKRYRSIFRFDCSHDDLRKNENPTHGI